MHFSTNSYCLYHWRGMVSNLIWMSQCSLRLCVSHLSSATLTFVKLQETLLFATLFNISRVQSHKFPDFPKKEGKRRLCAVCTVSSALESIAAYVFELYWFYQTAIMTLCFHTNEKKFDLTISRFPEGQPLYSWGAFLFIYPGMASTQTHTNMLIRFKNKTPIFFIVWCFLCT